jgi:hypothetical protein
LICAEQLFAVWTWLDVLGEPRLERVDGLIRFVRALELPGKGKPVAAVRLTVHAEKRVER